MHRNFNIVPMPVMRLRGNGNHPSPNNVGEHPPPSHLRSMTPIAQLFADLVVHASRNNPRNRTNAVSVSILNHLLDYGYYVYIMFLDIKNNFYTCTTVKQMIFFLKVDSICIWTYFIVMMLFKKRILISEWRGRLRYRFRQHCGGNFSKCNSCDPSSQGTEG